MVRALDRKLLRDLQRLLPQASTIALVVAAGIAAFASLRTTYGSLLASRDAYYEREAMPDLFVTLTRAPESALERVRALPGVRSAESRVEGSVRVLLEGDPDPPSGRVISLPDQGEPRLGRLVVRAGRLPTPESPVEAAVLESFATSQLLAVGDPLSIVVGGVERRVRIVGTVMTPELVMPMNQGDFAPDPGRVPVLFLRRSALAPSLGLEGAFDSVVVAIEPGTDARALARNVERVLAPFGAPTAIDRDHQASHHVLQGELAQLEGLATFVPALFLAVSAFLVHVVLSRLLELQRSPIAMLRAIGYSRAAIARHYLVLVVLVVTAGALVGLVLGHRLGLSLTALYLDYFRFPDDVYRFDPLTAAVAVFASAAAATLGAGSTLRNVMNTPPAAAMQPPVPPVVRRGWFERLGVARLLGPVLALVAREILRHPARAALSSAGVAFAVAIVVVGRFGYDSIEALMRVQFHEAMREDLSVALTRPAGAHVLGEVSSLPGVVRVEGSRILLATVTNGAARREVAVQTVPRTGILRRIVDRDGRPTAVPTDGILMTDQLARSLGVDVGDPLTITPRAGDSRSFELRVRGLVDEPFGLQVYAEPETLARALREEPRFDALLVRFDPNREAEVLRALRRRPFVAGVVRKRQVIERFASASGAQMRAFTAILSVFAAIIAVGVVYNNARVSLSMRERDLASLRVLGFSRAEISGVLLGEIAVHVFVGIPLGALLGRDWANRIASTVDPETYRMPVRIAAESYLLAAFVVVAASAVSAMLVRRKLDHLDLVAVLKTRA